METIAVNAIDVKVIDFLAWPMGDKGKRVAQPQIVLSNRGNIYEINGRKVMWALLDALFPQKPLSRQNFNDYIFYSGSYFGTELQTLCETSNSLLNVYCKKEQRLVGDSLFDVYVVANVMPIFTPTDIGGENLSHIRSILCDVEWDFKEEHISYKDGVTKLLPCVTFHKDDMQIKVIDDGKQLHIACRYHLGYEDYIRPKRIQSFKYPQKNLFTKVRHAVLSCIKKLERISGFDSKVLRKALPDDTKGDTNDKWIDLQEYRKYCLLMSRDLL